MDADKCIVCGAIIPEGRQVCPDCEDYRHCSNCCHRDKNGYEYPCNCCSRNVESDTFRWEPVGDDPIKPSYYNDTKYSPFDVIDDWGLNFYLGNAIKYIKRAGKKDGNSRLQDLKKVREYIDHEIKVEKVK